MTADVRKAVVTDFDLKSGLSTSKEPLRRHLSNLRGIFADVDAYEAELAKGDRLVYEFYDMGVPEKESEIAYGTSITYPGRVGSEYHMTKGHFHTVLDTAEVYYCLSGQGFMMMESPEGDVQCEELRPGLSVYVPGRYAHRSINTSDSEPLITFFAFPGHAGHDYGTIETKGMRKIVVDCDGTPTIVDNPNWVG